MPMPQTVLQLSPIGIPPYSARGLTETIKNIDAANQFRRDINGTLIKVSPAQFNKLAIQITCTDMDSPGINGVPIGTEITADLVNEMAFITASGSPSYPVVPGSTRTDGIWTFYRPRVVFLLMSLSIQRDEFGRAIAWELDLEEKG